MLAKKLAIGFGIMLFLPLLVYYGVRMFTPEPRWEDYQVKNYNERRLHASPEERIQLDGERDQLREKMKQAEKRFTQTLFSVAIPVGLLSILGGATLSSPAVGTGLMLGGIFSILQGYLAYWPELSDITKFCSLLAGLLLLIWLGYRRLGTTASS